jgi:hypothetical protein
MRIHTYTYGYVMLDHVNLSLFILFDQMNANAAEKAAASAAASSSSRHGHARRQPKATTADDGVVPTPFMSTGRVSQSANPFGSLDDEEDNDDNDDDAQTAADDE